MSIRQFNLAGKAIVEHHLNNEILLATDLFSALNKFNLLEQIKNAGNEWFTELKLVAYLNKRKKDFQATRSNSKSQMQLLSAGPYTTFEEEETLFGQISKETRLHLRWLYQVLDKKDHSHLGYWTCEKEYAVTLQEIKAYFAYLERSGVTVYQGLARDARSKLQGLLRGVPGADQRMYKQWAKRVGVDEREASEYIRHLKNVMGLGARNEIQRSASPSSAKEAGARVSSKSDEPPVPTAPVSSTNRQTRTDRALEFLSPAPSSGPSVAQAEKRKYNGDAEPQCNEVSKKPRTLVLQPRPHNLPELIAITSPTAAPPHSWSLQPEFLARVDPAPEPPVFVDEPVQGAKASPIAETRSHDFPLPPPSYWPTAPVPASYFTTDPVAVTLPEPKATAEVQEVSNTKVTTSTPQIDPGSRSPALSAQVEKSPSPRATSPKVSPRPPTHGKRKPPTLLESPFKLFGKHPLLSRAARHEHPIRIAQARVRKGEEGQHTNASATPLPISAPPAIAQVQAPAIVPTAFPLPAQRDKPSTPGKDVFLQTTAMSKDLDEPIEESILVCGTIWTPKPAVEPRSGQKESSNEESVGTSSLPQSNKSASPTNKPESHSVAEAYQTPPIATIEQTDVMMNTEYDEEDVLDEDELMYPEDEGSDYQPSDMEIDELDSD